MSTNQVMITTNTAEQDADVREIWQTHGRVAERLLATKADAVRIGELLTQRRAKFPKRAPKGAGFGEWVEQNLPFGRTTAFGYMRAYAERDTFLSNVEKTIRHLMGNKATTHHPTPDNNNGSNEDNQELNPDDEVIVLTERQQKRAEQLREYFGVSLTKAQRYVRDTAPRPRAPNANPTPTDPTLTKRTIRIAHDTDDLIHNVARTTNRSYAQVANELFEVGRQRFVRRYKLNAPE